MHFQTSYCLGDRTPANVVIRKSIQPLVGGARAAGIRWEDGLGTRPEQARDHGAKGGKPVSGV
jgi:hypothetical protein